MVVTLVTISHPSVEVYVTCFLYGLLNHSLAMKDSWGPVKALAVAATINVVGDIVLCRFLGFGIAGAAWATMTSQVCERPYYHLCGS